MKVDSSNLDEITYDEAKKELKIKFKKSGKWYQYDDVPKEVHTALMDAESHGVYFNAHIRNKYKTTPLD